MPTIRAFARHRSAPRSSVSAAAVPAVVRALTAATLATVPGRLEVTSTDVPAARLDGHPRLPSDWHHQPVVMTALNLLTGIALVLFLHHTAGVPARMAHAAAGTVRRWWTLLPSSARLLTRRADADRPAPRKAPCPAVTLPGPRALAVLWHRAQPCAP
ncbi:hypothetical protein [Streptomyces sp. NPDC056144]|uniref:hypothetical protein n=1 Tax=unclassified Streptomyces TaxID=2593676 RepID=UPI0035D7E909